MKSPEGSYSLLKVDISDECRKKELNKKLSSSSECEHKVTLIYINEDDYIHTEIHTLYGTDIYGFLLDLYLKDIEIDPYIIQHFEVYKLKYILNLIKNNNKNGITQLINHEFITSYNDDNLIIGAIQNEKLEIIKLLENNGWETQTDDYYYEAIISGNNEIISHIIKNNDILFELMDWFTDNTYITEESNTVFEWLIVFLNDKDQNLLELFWNNEKLDKLTEHDIRLNYIQILDSYGYISTSYMMYNLFSECNRKRVTIIDENGIETTVNARLTELKDNETGETFPYTTNELITKYFCDECLYGETNISNYEIMY